MVNIGATQADVSDLADSEVDWDQGTITRRRSKTKHHENVPLVTLADQDDFPTGEVLDYTRKGLLKIGKYKIVQESAGYEKLKGLRPGDNLPEEHHLARYNNTWMRLQDEKDYLRRKDRKKIRRGKPTQWFEKHADHGISRVHARMMQDRL